MLYPSKRENVPILGSEMTLKIANVNKKTAPAILLKYKKNSWLQKIAQCERAFNVRDIGITTSCTIRVATAQGKQGIWLLTFPDRENAGNLVNLFFYTGKMVPTRKILNF